MGRRGRSVREVVTRWWGRGGRERVGEGEREIRGERIYEKGERYKEMMEGRRGSERGRENMEKERVSGSKRTRLI